MPPDLMFPKPKRIEDRDFLDFAKTYPCAVVNWQNTKCSGEIHPHHTKSVGSGGSDYTAVPLCVLHHSEIHTIGRESFEAKYPGAIYERRIEVLQGYLETRNRRSDENP